MDVSEKWGTDIDTAVDLALADLKATRDEVEITVLEQPSRGFFGIGSKLALVRVERKKPEPAPKEKKIKTEACETENARPAKKEKHHRREGGHQKKDTAERRDYKKSESVIIREDESFTPLEEHPALTFLKELTEQMNLDINVSAKTDGENIYIDMNGKDSGTVIGKRGQTLDAIQYLTSLVVNKDGDEYIRVVVDAENYRTKREKTLEKLAERLADKVVRTKRSVRLEPMNPYERKVIHATLQSNPRVTTRSEGQDPYRRVIIELK